MLPAGRSRTLPSTCNHRSKAWCPETQLQKQSLKKYNMVYRNTDTGGPALKRNSRTWCLGIQTLRWTCTQRSTTRRTGTQTPRWTCTMRSCRTWCTTTQTPQRACNHRGKTGSRRMRLMGTQNNASTQKDLITKGKMQHDKDKLHNLQKKKRRSSNDITPNQNGPSPYGY